ncbi:hypothetical protein J4423_04755 [Candidatus Pacearchaeota archaeon]|nr:hypothetical protein [Candidatus Pacearchaeota archaeon]
MSIKINLEEKYHSGESDGESYRWQDRNPPKTNNIYQPPRIRQNPPRYPEHRSQDIDDKYK